MTSCSIFFYPVDSRFFPLSCWYGLWLRKSLASTARKNPRSGLELSRSRACYWMASSYQSTSPCTAVHGLAYRWRVASLHCPFPFRLNILKSFYELLCILEIGNLFRSSFPNVCWPPPSFSRQGVSNELSS